ncbi:hypothetical protein AA309_04520 [Microvirga vignae]|uniref:Uncharacterized protein n=1 Tax=Microvirga vignae TaxID=1225564 RepID=A0A0H1RG92_9HYPH|nr:hypothetical protein AA309_04520 [Microvirga vignae]
MQADTHRPPERRSGATCEKVDPVFRSKRCAILENEHRIGHKSGFHFWVRCTRLLWFVLIYLASLAAFAVLVYGLRFIIPH